MINEEKPKSFNEVWSDVKDQAELGNCHLLLGNGFSIDCSDEFKYNSLYEKANLQQVCPAVHSFAEKNNLYDLEKIIGVLQDSRELLESYAQHEKNSGVYQKCLNNLKKHIYLVKKVFVSTIETVHPVSPYKVNCDKAYNFVSRFNKIFTLNYDVLLYWTLMSRLKREKKNGTTGSGHKGDALRFCDGFGEIDGRLVWLASKADDVTVWYLHGALHLYLSFDDEFEFYYLKKLRSQRSVNLLKLIRQNINNGHLPLVVAEGSSSKKKFQIDQYSYLWHAYNALKTLNGILFTFGVSFREEDQHILEAIHESELSDVYVGVYDPEEAGELERIMARIKKIQEAYRKKKEKKQNQDQDEDKDGPTYHFYKSDTVKPWGRKDR